MHTRCFCECPAQSAQRREGKGQVQWSAMSKVVSPASAYASMASTAASRSMRPHPPLVCHMPLSTRHIARESPLLLTVATLAGPAVAVSVAAAPAVHLAGLRRRGRGGGAAAAGETARAAADDMGLACVRARVPRRRRRRDKALLALGPRIWVWAARVSPRKKKIFLVVSSKMEKKLCY